jgi:hypothetical protein
MDTGIGPTGCERTLSIVTSSLLLVKTRARLKTNLAEREHRTKVTANTKVFQVIEGRIIPDWKKFLSVKENKQALKNVFGDFIVKFNQSNPLVPPKELGKLHFRTASLDQIYKMSSLYHLHGTWTPG